MHGLIYVFIFLFPLVHLFIQAGEDVIFSSDIWSGQELPSNYSLTNYELLMKEHCSQERILLVKNS